MPGVFCTLENVQKHGETIDQMRRAVELMFNKHYGMMIL